MGAGQSTSTNSSTPGDITTSSPDVIQSAAENVKIGTWDRTKQRDYPVVLPIRKQDADMEFQLDRVYTQESSQELIFFIDAIAEHLLKGKFGNIAELTKLAQPGICSKYVTILSSQIGEIVNTIPLKAIMIPGEKLSSDETKPPPNQPQDNVLFFEKDIFEAMNIHNKKNPELKKKLCDRIAYFFIRLIQIYSAIYLALHPRFRDDRIYKKSRNNTTRTYSRMVPIAFERFSIKNNRIVNVYSPWTREKKREQLTKILQNNSDPTIINDFNIFRQSFLDAQRNQFSSQPIDETQIRTRFIDNQLQRESFFIQKRNPYFSLIENVASGGGGLKNTGDNSSGKDDATLQLEKLAKMSNMNEFRRNALLMISQNGQNANINICKFADKKKIDEITGITELISLFEPPNVPGIRDTMPKEVKNQVENNVKLARLRLLQTFGDPEIIGSAAATQELPAEKMREIISKSVDYQKYLGMLGCKPSAGQAAFLVSHQIPIGENPRQFMSQYSNVIAIQEQMKLLHAKTAAKLMGFLRLLFTTKRDAASMMGRLGENYYTHRNFFPLAPFQFQGQHSNNPALKDRKDDDYIAIHPNLLIGGISALEDIVSRVRDIILDYYIESERLFREGIRALRNDQARGMGVRVEMTPEMNRFFQI